MEYIILAVLTLLVFSSIINLLIKKQKKRLSKPMYKQSDVHRLIKNFFDINISVQEKTSQMKKREEENSVKIVVVDEKAYWVVDNVFYVADIVDDRPDQSSIKPVDTSNMSKEDIDKMLFILDNLDKGDTNDSGSSGK